MAPFYLLNLICSGIFNIIVETVTIFTLYEKCSVRRSTRREFGVIKIAPNDGVYASSGKKKWTKWADWQLACSWDMALAGHWTGTRYAGKAAIGFVLGSLDGTSRFLGEWREPDLLVHGAVRPGLGWFLRPAENLFLMEVSGTRGCLSAELAKARCQGKWESNTETQVASTTDMH